MESNSNKNERAANNFLESDGTLANLGTGHPNNPAYVSESIRAAMGTASTGNISDEFNSLNNLMMRLNNENSAQIYQELEKILKGRILR